jgi:hypothetical protein
LNPAAPSALKPWPRSPQKLQWSGGDWPFFNDITKLTLNFHQTLPKLSPNFIKLSPILENFCLPFLTLALSEHAPYQRVIQHHHDLGLLYRNFFILVQMCWKEQWHESFNQALTIYHSGSSLCPSYTAQSEQVSAWCAYQRKRNWIMRKKSKIFWMLLGFDFIVNDNMGSCKDDMD